jgi:hypothetical protein
MANPLKLYKSFIDGLLEIREEVLRVWITRRGWPDLPENRKFNQLREELTPRQRRVVADMLQDARDGGIHDTLVYLHDRICIDGLRLVQNGVEHPVEPFDTSLYWDWVSRREGDTWPDERKRT